MRRLLINADDFGLTPGINRAVAELHAAGALRSATLMATGPTFDDAVALAHIHPGLGIGCHIVLTDGTPTLPPEQIPTLLSPPIPGETRRQFRPSLARFITALLTGRLRESEIAAEAIAQIRRLQAAGLTVTHLDTHKHTHIFPPVARALLTAAEATGVRALRNPFEPAWCLRLGRATPLRRLQILVANRLRPRFLALLRGRNILTTDGTIGVSATGHLDRATLDQLLNAMPEGTWELVCHPGYNDPDLDQVTTRLRASREIERHALLAALGRCPELLTLTAAANSPHKFPPGPPAAPHPPPPAIIHYGDLLAESSLTTPPRSPTP